MNKGCTCVIDCEVCCDYEPEIYHRNKHTLVSGNKCYECGELLPPETDVIKTTAKWDYDLPIQEIHTCLDCYSLEKYLCCDIQHGGLYDMIWDYLDGCDENSMPTECLPYLTPKARQWLCKAIEDCWIEIDELNKETEE